ncbi:Uncharacterised protein [Streptococcus acidominimus]|uniref:Uncharacterized protein n=1 Tax=Streptococcus acidominimus TaxID=1326 RepID=A0A380IEU2_STRAI|nr:Uncharacterised protein [Streptococcus acidominimus]
MSPARQSSCLCGGLTTKRTASVRPPILSRSCSHSLGIDCGRWEINRVSSCQKLSYLRIELELQLTDKKINTPRSKSFFVVFPILSRSCSHSLGIDCGRWEINRVSSCQKLSYLRIELELQLTDKKINTPRSKSFFVVFPILSRSCLTLSYLIHTVATVLTTELVPFSVLRFEYSSLSGHSLDGQSDCPAPIRPLFPLIIVNKRLLYLLESPI